MKFSFKSLWSSLISDFSYKIVAFFVAVSLWVSFAGKHNQVLLMQVPVNYTLSDGYVFRKRAPKSIQIRISGPSVSINKMSALSEPLLFDLQNKKEGVNQIEVSKEMFSLPLGVKLIEVIPKKIRVKIVKVKEQAEPKNN